MGLIFHMSCFAYFVLLYIITNALYSLSPCCKDIFGNFGKILAVFIFSNLSLAYIRKRFLKETVDVTNKAIFVTGCDSGFGNLLAERLDSIGFTVFAGCLQPSKDGAIGLKERCSPKLHIVDLNVTSDESVANASKFVQDNLKRNELWAVVNNAGVLRGLSVEFTEISDFQTCMEVNAFGHVRVAKAFLPLLRKSKGRIVNVTSILGRAAFAYQTPYTMSKYATAAFNDCLRSEVKKWGIRVIAIEPEGFRTNMTNENSMSKVFDDAIISVPKEIRSEYGEDYIKQFKVAIINSFNISSEKVHKVVDDMEKAVSLENPQMIYRPSRNYFAFLSFKIFEYCPMWLKDILLAFTRLVFRFP